MLTRSGIGSRKRGARPFGSWLWVPLTTVGQLIRVLFRSRMGWLLPFVLLLLLVATALAVLSASGPLAPFIYPLL
jgi:hypothetical protein